MSKNRLLIAAILLVALGIVGFFALRGERTFVPFEVANEYSRSFAPGQIEPGWNLRSVGRGVERATRLVHRVEVRPDLAGDLILMSNIERRNAIAAVACPDSSHEIWQKLTRRQDIEIEIHSENGKVTSIDCRSAVF